MDTVQDQAELYDLLGKICSRDQAALGAFYDLTVGRVFGIVMRVTANRELAEEVTSDVYMQVWRNAESYQAGRSTPLSWLLVMAHSRSIDALRREGSATRNQVPIEDGYDAPDMETADPLKQTLDMEQGGELAEALKLLDRAQREMITLAFFRGLTHQEIAHHTGKPLGTVKSVLRRAQSILRGALEATRSDSSEGEYYGQA